MKLKLLSIFLCLLMLSQLIYAQSDNQLEEGGTNPPPILAEEEEIKTLELLTTTESSLELVEPLIIHITYEGLTSQSVRLHWEEVEGDEVTYELYQEGSLIATTEETMLDLEGLSPNTTYIFYIQAYNSLGEMLGESQNLTLNTPIEGQGIYTREDLENIKDDLSGNYLLMNDLDLSGELFTAIGESGQAFSGHFDGNGYTIHNLAIEDSNDNIGLFKALSSATITNVVFTNPRISASSNAGVLAGTATDSEIDNVIIENAEINGKNQYIGGLVGQAIGTEIKKVTLDAGFNLTGTNYVGGLVGRMVDGSITSSKTTVTIEANKSGGLVGSAEGQVEISKSQSEGYLSGVDHVGGIVGTTSGKDILIEEVAFYGEVEGIGNYMGGIVGDLLENTLRNSYAIGEVSGIHYVGGIAGSASSSNSTLENSYASVAIEGHNNKGGLVGHAFTSLDNSYYDGVVSQLTPYYNQQPSRLSVELTIEETFENWDFDSIWSIEEGHYPYLTALGSHEALANVPQVVEGGKGTISHPYLISDRTQLSRVVYALDKHYQLMNDISMGAAPWTPIGSSDLPFTGTLEGDGYSIYDLTFEDSQSNEVGLFGVIENGKVKNLKLMDVNLKGWRKVGAVAGKNTGGTLLNITVSGQVIGIEDVGLLVGLNESGAYISHGYTRGYVQGEYQTGGLVGNNNVSVIERSYSEAEVKGIRHTVGGLVGLNKNSGEINNCYALGTVSNSDYVGGLVGKNENASIRQSYTASQVTGKNLPGGLVAQNTGEILNSYWDMTVTGQSTSQGGQGLSTEHMKEQQTFDEWNFETLWTIEEAITYPYFQPLAVAIETIDTQLTYQTVSLTWPEVPHATSYDIYFDGNFYAVDEASFSMEGLDPASEHTFQVRVIASELIGDWSDVMEILLPPDAPKELNANVTDETVTLTWEAVYGADSYEIEMMGQPVAVGSVLTYTVHGLKPNTPYIYRVRSVNGGGHGPWSEVEAATTLPGVTEGIQLETESDQIQVAWEAVSGAKSYDLEINGEIVSDLVDNDYLHQGLVPNTAYTYRVRAVKATGQADWSEPVTGYTRLLIPDLTVEEVLPDQGEDTTYDITWTEVEGAEEYELEVDGESFVLTGNTYSHEGIEPNSSHYYRVRAINSHTQSRWSLVTSQIGRLSMPTQLQGEIQETALMLQWESVIGVKNYEVELNGTIYQTGLATYFTLEGVAPNTTYSYRVRAVNDESVSRWTEYQSLESPLAVPSNFRATSDSKRIILYWEEIPQAEGYELLVDGISVMVGDVGSYEHTGLTPNTLHTYRIRAINQGVAGPWSEVLKVTTVLNGIYRIHVDKVTSYSIKVSWGLVEGASGYIIEVDGVLIDLEDKTYYNHKDLSPSTTYRYRVKAYDDNGESGWSDYLEVETAPEVPIDLEAVATEHTITLTWNDIEDADGYQVEADGIIYEVSEALFEHPGLLANSSHSYRVRALGSNSSSEWSELLLVNTRPTLMVQVNRDDFFNFVFVIPANGTGTRYISVYYEKEDFEVTDLCAITPQLETEVGPIEGTSIEVVAFEAGYIRYKITGANRTVTNTIQFISKTNEYSEVIYEIE